MMKFEDILNMYQAATMEALLYSQDNDEYSNEQCRRHVRQRDAFQARLVKMYNDPYLQGYKKGYVVGYGDSEGGYAYDPLP